MLDRDFFAGATVEIARELIGYRLVRVENGTRLSGRIVETEAYTQDDPAFHGWDLWNRETGELEKEGRGAALFGPPGTAYVYLCYGVHWLFSVVTEEEGTGGAVLIRAVEPLEGTERMRRRRGEDRSRVELTNGPGKLSEAFGIDEGFDGRFLDEPELHFERPDGASGEGEFAEDVQIATSSRIGISKAVERPWRFFVQDHPYVSRGTPSDRRTP
jgi:DNA-3-methyladenine glycosylase